jgi:hypothetical protein
MTTQKIQNAKPSQEAFLIRIENAEKQLDSVIERWDAFLKKEKRE